MDEDAGSDRAAPILGKLALRQRRLVAANLLSRLPDVVTHYGTLVIENLDLDSDWLRAEDIAGVIANFQSGQVHWFSWPGALEPTEELAELQASGRLVLHTAKLSDVLNSAISEGRFPTEPSENYEADDRTIALNGRHIALPRGLLTRAESLGRIVRPAAETSLPPLDQEAQFGLLREFLRDAVGSDAVWEALSRNLPVVRTHDSTLLKAADGAIRHIAGKRRAVLLAGPAGSGRSVSLARLARDLAQRGDVLVYFSNSYVAPPEELLEELSNFAAKHGALSTVLIWDANRTPTEYQRLVDFAYSRGEKLVVVGSCYRTQRHVRQAEYVEASPHLAESERKGLAALLQRFGINTDRFTAATLDDHLLVLLYRFVQATRPRLGAALSTEAQHFSFQIRDELKDVAAVGASMTALASALADAGLIPADPTREISLQADTWRQSMADELIAVTMAVGRHGIDIPLELAVRACGQTGHDQMTWAKVEKILREVDLVELKPDDDGVVRISPRHQVEARILCDRLLGGSDAEMAIFARLAESARHGDGLGAASDPELKFVTELCSVIGPNARDESVLQRYRGGYRALAEALQRRRQGAPIHTDLAMQEAVLWREDMISKEDPSGRAPDSAVTHVEEAVELLNTAIDTVRRKGWRSRHLRNLRVERATLIGTLTFDMTRKGAARSEIMARLDEVRSEAVQLGDSDPTFYYPRDVLLWTTANALAASSLKPEDQATLTAELRTALLEIREDDLPADQLEKFLDRKQRIGRVLQDTALSNEALGRLRALGSAIPDRLAALDLAGAILANDGNEQGDTAKLAEAKRILQAADTAGHLDTAGRRLLLRISWRLATGQNLFARERAPTPKAVTDVEFCRTQASLLVRESGSFPPQQFMFLMAVLSWIEGNYTLARDVWHELEQMADRGNPYRIRKLLLMHGTNGPVVFRGRIVSVHPDGRSGRIRLEENGQQIHISAADFRRPALRRDENLQVSVAFNYLGPIVVPPG